MNSNCHDISQWIFPYLWMMGLRTHFARAALTRSFATQAQASKAAMADAFGVAGHRRHRELVEVILTCFRILFRVNSSVKKKKRYHKSNWDILGKTWSKPGTIHQRYLGPFWSGSIIIQQMQRWIPNRWSMRTLGLESQGDASWIHGVGIYKGDYAKSAFCGDVI